MLKFSSLVGRAMEAANHSKNSAMEAENHVKHGTNSKSHTSRRNFCGTLCCLLLALCVGFPACGDDDGDNDNIKSSGIVGKWQMIESSFTDFEPCNFEGWDEFKSDGTFVSFGGCGGETWTGTWKLEGNNITAVHDDFPGNIVFTIVSVSANELVLSGIRDGKTHIDKYKRI